MLNKLDILSGIDEIQLCAAYEVDGERVDAWPSSADVLARATPIYERLRRLGRSIHDVRALNDLPETRAATWTALEEQAGVPITLVSVGPERTQTIERAARPSRRGIARPPAVGAGAREPADHADPDPHRRQRWTRARARLEARRRAGRERVVVAPGSDGIGRRGRVACAGRRHRWIPARSSRSARREAVDLVVIGPEAPLAAGSPTRCVAAGVRDVRADRAPRRGSRRSKAFCREIAEAAGVPMAAAAPSTTADAAAAFARGSSRWRHGVVVKADGLAAGKGVTVCDDLDEAEAAIRAACRRGFAAVPAAAPGRRGGAPERPRGERDRAATADSVLALPAARDHKRLEDGDNGPNTGGHGRLLPACPTCRRGRRGPAGPRSTARSSRSWPGAARRSAARSSPG